MKRLTIFTLILLLVCTFSATALTAGDIFLSTPVIAKAVVPTVAAITQLIDESSTDAVIMASFEIGLFTLPNAFLLYSVYTENPEWTKVARTITKFTDGIAGAVFTGYGIYLVAGFSNQIAGWDQIVGIIALLYSIPVWVAFGLDFIPYSFEKKATY